MGACSSQPQAFKEERNNRKSRKTQSNGLLVWKFRSKQPNKENVKKEKQETEKEFSDKKLPEHLRRRDVKSPEKHEKGIEKDKFIIQNLPSSPYVNSRLRYSLHRDRNQNETIETVQSNFADEIQLEQGQDGIISTNNKSKGDDSNSKIDNDKQQIDNIKQEQITENREKKDVCKVVDTNVPDDTSNKIESDHGLLAIAEPKDELSSNESINIGKLKVLIYDKYAEQLAERIQQNAMTGITSNLQISKDSYVDSITRSILEDAKQELLSQIDANENKDHIQSDELDVFVKNLVNAVLQKGLSELTDETNSSKNSIDIQPEVKDGVDGEENSESHLADCYREDQSKTETALLKVIEEKKYDRPLSGYAEKLAAFLDEDDELELSDSDEENEKEIDRPIAKPLSEEHNESDNYIDDDDNDDKSEDEETDSNDDETEDSTSSYTSEATISQTEISEKENFAQNKLVDDCEIIMNSSVIEEPLVNGNIKCPTKQEINSASTNGVVRRQKRKNKDRRNRGERPKSLFEQDLLNSILDEEALAPLSDEEETIDDIKPVSERARQMENIIPLVPKRSNSVTSDIYTDDLFGYQRSRKPSQLKPPVLRKAIVIDPGCGALKAGISGEIRPTCYCPSVIGVPRRFSQDVSKMKKGFYVGDEAWTVAGMLQIEHPIKQEIHDWSDVSNIYEYIFDEALTVNSNEHPVLLTELGLTSNKNREKLSEIMFEKFSVPLFYLANQSCLALYSKALVSGLVLNSGFYHTQATPIYEGHALPHATTQLDIGGDQVTDFLGRSIMGTQGIVFNTSSEKLVLNSMKQELCYVAIDPKTEEAKYKNNPNLLELFALPDGQHIEIGSERFIAPEIMFDPSIIGIRNQPNVVEMLRDSISRIDVDLKSTMVENILISGGNSKLKGFQERLKSEAMKQPDEEMVFNCVDDPLLSTWLGGSVLASIQGYRDQWVTLDHYAEYGSQVIHKMCF